MKYRTRDGKPLADADAINSFSKGIGAVVKEQSNTLYTVLSGIFEYFVGVFAFLTKSFLRVRLGERTFGVFTILSIYFLVWFISYYPEIYDDAIKNPVFGANPNSFGYKIFVFFGSFLALPLEFLEKGAEKGFMNMLMNYELHLFVFLIILIGIGHLIDVYSRRFKQEIVHSYYRGDSLLFTWLIGKKIRGYTIDSKIVWMVIEPLFVLFIAWTISSFLKVSSKSRPSVYLGIKS